MGARKFPPLLERIEAKTEKLPERDGGHWIWTGGTHGRDVPQIGRTIFQGRRVTNPRVVLTLNCGGVVGKSRRVYPICGERKCIRPDHMYVGHRKGIPRYKGRSLRLVSNEFSARRANIAYEYRRGLEMAANLRAHYSLAALGEKYGLSRERIRQIVLREGITERLRIAKC